MTSRRYTGYKGMKARGITSTSKESNKSRLITMSSLYLAAEGFDVWPPQSPEFACGDLMAKDVKTGELTVFWVSDVAGFVPLWLKLLNLQGIASVVLGNAPGVPPSEDKRRIEILLWKRDGYTQMVPQRIPLTATEYEEVDT